MTPFHLFWWLLGRFLAIGGAVTVGIVALMALWSVITKWIL